MADTTLVLSSTPNASTTTTIDSSSIYYLHPSDNPGALITSVLLRGDNYMEWATKLSNSIQAKRKLGFIQGTILRPTSEPDLSRWLATNSMLVGWIRTSIDPKIRSTVTFVPEAHKLWDNLQRRFSVRNGVRIHQLRDEINTCHQDGQTVIGYYGRLTKLWEELDNLKTTRSCSCDASADLEKEREEIRVHKFIFGLDESRFRNIRSQIINEEPLPEINNVYARIIREEQHNNTSRSKEHKTEAIGFNAQSASTDLTKSDTQNYAAVFTRSRDPNRTCTHCLRKGHEQSECFLLHGYPEWWQEQRNANNSGNTSRGRGGRFQNSGRGRGRSNSTRALTNNASTSPSPTLSNDQITQLLQLLQSSRTSISSEKLSGKTTLKDVIIDTGASQHMTGDLYILTDVVDIQLPLSAFLTDVTLRRQRRANLFLVVTII